MKTFESIFTTENAAKVAQSILKSMDDEETIVDYDFRFQQGEFVSDDINTWIKFDTDKYPLLQAMLETLMDEEIEPTKERVDLFTKFREEICGFLAGELKAQVSNKLRECVFGGKIDADMCPIKKIKVISFDLADVPDSAKYLLVVKKEQPKDNIAPSVSKDLYDYLHTLDDEQDFVYTVEDENGETVETNVPEDNEKMTKEEIEQKLNDFISEKRDCDSKFKYIKEVKLKKAFFECQVELFADYTMLKPEDINTSGGIENIPDF
jgi:hypothetical protein